MKFLRVNMSEKSVQFQNVPKEYAGLGEGAHFRDDQRGSAAEV